MGKKMTFSGGLLLKPEKRQTIALPIEPLPAPPVVTIPLLQHGNGSPARPMVSIGDTVAMGQMIGQPEDGAAAAVHASVSGTVTAIRRDPYTENKAALSITIENNGKDEFASPIPYDNAWNELDPAELIQKIALSGITDGTGPYAPLHTKLKAVQHKPLESIIVNALLPEPLLCADARSIIEQTEKFLNGILILKKITGAAQCKIAINTVSPEISSALDPLLADKQFESIQTIRLKPKYPLQHDRVLLYACTGRETASTALPGETGSMVVNAATAVRVRDAVMECIPLFQRVVTVAGPGVESPKNLLVRIGTPVELLVEACGIDREKTSTLIFGGELSGICVPELNAPVTKSHQSVLALTEDALRPGNSACINCRRCMAVCPMRLSPMRIYAAAAGETPAEAAEWHAGECIECGCCSYVCPSKIDLVHYIQYGKRQSRHDRDHPRVIGTAA